MSELINPGVELTPDVPESVESETVNYSEKTLAELVNLFEELVRNEERMKMSKDAEAIKSAFYKRLQKEKADVGLVSEPVVEPSEDDETVAEQPEEEIVTVNPFVEIERGFKEIYKSCPRRFRRPGRWSRRRQFQRTRR